MITVTLLDPEMYKFPQMFKTSLKCIKINHNCINRPQMYKNWPHLYKQGTDKCTNNIDHFANLKCIKINHKYK